MNFLSLHDLAFVNDFIWFFYFRVFINVSLQAIHEIKFRTFSLSRFPWFFDFVSLMTSQFMKILIFIYRNYSFAAPISSTHVNVLLDKMWQKVFKDFVFATFG